MDELEHVCQAWAFATDDLRGHGYWARCEACTFEVESHDWTEISELMQDHRDEMQHEAEQAEQERQHG